MNRREFFAGVAALAVGPKAASVWIDEQAPLHTTLVYHDCRVEIAWWSYSRLGTVESVVRTYQPTLRP